MVTQAIHHSCPSAKADYSKDYARLVRYLIGTIEMLNATSTRDLNQAARSAEKFLQELGFVLPHAKALDLVARLVGKPHHMAAQAGLPNEPTTSAMPAAPAVAGVPSTVVEAVRQVVFGCGATADANGFVQVLKKDLDVLYQVTNEAVEAVGPQDDTKLAAAVSVIEDLCRIMTHRDVETALYEVGISDAANAALASASAYVSEAALANFSLDSLQEAYDDLPVSVDAEDFSEGHGNWSLSEAEFRLAKRLADALYAGRRQRAEELSSQDVTRLVAQFEMATGKSGNIARTYLETKSNLSDVAIAHFEKVYDVDLSVGPWLIVNDAEKGYWCNGFGWTSSRLAANGYSDAYRQSTSVRQMSAVFGNSSRWVRFADAADFPQEG